MSRQHRDGVGRRHLFASYSIHPLVGNTTSLGSYGPSFKDKSCINISIRREQCLPPFSMAHKPLRPSLAFPIKGCYPKFSNTSCNPFMKSAIGFFYLGLLCLLGDYFST